MTSTGSSSHLEMGLNWTFGGSIRLPAGAAGVAASSAGADVATVVVSLMLEGATAAVSVVDPPDASDIVIAVDGIVLR